MLCANFPHFSIYRFQFSFLFFSSSALWATDTAIVNSKPFCDSEENNDPLGNQANDVLKIEKMKAKAIARFNDQNEVTSRIEPIDGQSYSIGLQEGFLLKQRKPGWEARLDQETDRRMIDLLLEDVQPESEFEIEPRIKTYGDSFKIQMKNFEEKTIELSKNLKS